MPAIDPTLSSVEDMARRLPANARAMIEWFPQTLRSTFIEPLKRSSRERFREKLDTLTVDAVRAFLRLLANFSRLSDLIDPDALALAADERSGRAVISELIERKLEPVAADAADDLREAEAWLRAILGATAIGLGSALRDPDMLSQMNAVSAQEMLVSDDEIRTALLGEAGMFFRGLLLTISALDVLHDEDLPDSIREWCGLAFSELHAAANALRASGLPVPTEVDVPGSPYARRRRLRRPLLEFSPRAPSCPPGVIHRVVEVLRPEQVWLFGSRARGEAHRGSDWDLLVVLPDSASPSLDETTWSELRDVRRQRVDIVPMRRSDFEKERDVIGTLAYSVAQDGHLLYER